MNQRRKSVTAIFAILKILALIVVIAVLVSVGRRAYDFGYPSIASAPRMNLPATHIGNKIASPARKQERHRYQHAEFFTDRSPSSGCGFLYFASVYPHGRIKAR